MNKKRLNIILTLLFFGAMLMGPGPGLLLVNPDIESPNVSVLGVPIIYAWGLLWYAVLVAIIIAAYKLVWSKEDDPTEDQET